MKFRKAVILPVNQLLGISMKRIVAIVFVLGLLGVVLLGWMMFGENASFQTGLSSYEGLPQAASDITVYRNANISGNVVVDFRISEPDFVSFAAEKHWAVQPISGAEFVFHAEAFREGRPNDKKEISDGLYYAQRASNAGGVTAAYDRKDSRAYIQSSSR